MIGSTGGESAVPVLIGIAMGSFGSMALAYSMIACIGVMILLYLLIHGSIVCGLYRHLYNASGHCDVSSALMTENQRKGAQQSSADMERLPDSDSSEGFELVVDEEGEEKSRPVELQAQN